MIDLIKEKLKEQMEVNEIAVVCNEFTIQILRIADKYGKDRGEIMKKALFSMVMASEETDFNTFEI